MGADGPNSLAAAYELRLRQGGLNTQEGNNHMAKGQVRGNKEVRKPKKDKGVAKSAADEGSQVKLATGFMTAKKGK